MLHAEEVHGEELRQALRQICAVPMPPAHDPVTMQRAEAAVRTGTGPKGAGFKERMQAAARKSIAQTLAKRPAGCITMTEAVARSGFQSEFPVRRRMREAGIGRHSKTAQFVWYSEAKLKAAGIITGVLLALLPGLAGAQQIPQCQPDVAMQAQLLNQHGEKPAAYGLAANGKLVIQVLVDPRDGSWTIIQTWAPGDDQPLISCALASGTDWEALAPGEPS